MKLLKRSVLALVILGLLVFFGVPYFVGTSWAKDHIQTTMAEETGRKVSIGSVSFSWFSGLAVSDVTVHQAQPEFEKEGPLFHLGSLKLEVGLRDVLAKKLNVEEFSIVEPRVVVVRDKDGNFNFDDLMKKPGDKSPSSPEPSGEGGKKPGEKSPGEAPAIEAKLNVREGKVLYIDIPLGTRIEMDDIATTATWVDGKLVMDMGFLLNGGNVAMKGNMDLSRDPAPFHLEEIVIDEATLGSNLTALAPFLVILGKNPQTASGKIRFSMKDVTGEGFTMKQLSKSLTAKGGVNLEGAVISSGVISQLINLIAGGDASEEISIKLLGSTFQIKDGKIRTDDMKIATDSFDLELAGWTNLRGKMEYTVRASRLDAYLDKNPKWKEYLGKDGSLPLKITGSVDSPKLDFDVEGALKGAAGIGIEKGLDRLLGGDRDK